MRLVRFTLFTFFVGVFGMVIGGAATQAAKVDVKQSLDVRWTAVRREPSGLRVFFEFRSPNGTAITSTFLVLPNGKKLFRESGKALAIAPGGSLAKALAQIPVTLDTLQTALMASGELTP